MSNTNNTLQFTYTITQSDLQSICDMFNRFFHTSHQELPKWTSEEFKKYYGHRHTKMDVDHIMENERLQKEVFRMFEQHIMVGQADLFEVWNSDGFVRLEKTFCEVTDQLEPTID